MAVEIEQQKENSVPVALIIIFAILAAGILASGYIFYWHYKKEYRAEVEHELSAIADLKVSQLSQWRSERMGDAAMLSDNRTFSALVRRVLNNPRDREAERQVRDWISLFPKAYEYNMVRLIDPRGKRNIAFPVEPQPISSTISKNVAEVARSKRVTMSDFYRHNYDQRVYIAVLAPIFDPRDRNKVIAVVSLRVDPERYLYSFILRWPTHSPTAETLLLRRDGNDALYLSDLRFRRDSALKHRIPLDRKDTPEAMALLGRTGIAEGVDYHGEEVIADIRIIPGSPWFLLALKDASEIYGPERRALWIIIGLMAALLIGSGASLAFFWRQHTIGFYLERYQAAEALRKSEKKLNDITSNIGEGIYVLDGAGRLLFMNPEAERLFGWTMDEMNERGPHELVHFRTADGSPLPICECNMHKVIRTGERYSSSEEYFVHRDGSVFPVHVISTPLVEDGKVVASITAFQDITERKRAEKELSELNRNFVTLLENTTDFVYFKDENSRFIFCSQTLANITGHASWKDMIGKHDLEVFPEEIAKIYQEEELPIFQDGAPLLNRTDPYCDTEGKMGWVNTNKWPVFDNANKVIGIFGISRDITERKKSEDALERANEKLRSKAQELELAYRDMESFSYAISHDLKAPARRIRDFSETALKECSGRLDDNGRHMLKRIKVNAANMAQLIEDLLSFSRVSRTEIVKSEIDMESLGNQVCEELKTDIGERQVTIDIKRLPTAHGDLSMMHQVLSNLFSNALKFTKMRAQALIEMGGREKDGEDVYYVRDNGIGFDMRYADKLFGLFQRIHSDKEIEGTGVGLVIVKKIIEKQGGRVWAEGKLNEGATFYFSLPGNSANEQSN